MELFTISNRVMLYRKSFKLCHTFAHYFYFLFISIYKKTVFDFLTEIVFFVWQNLKVF